MQVTLGQSSNGDGWPSISSNNTLSGGGSDSFSQAIGSGVQSVQYAFSLPAYNKIIAAQLLAGAPMQIKCNASGGASLISTINLQSGLALLWCVQYSGLYQSPFGSGAALSNIWVTCSGQGGQLQINALYDPTT